MILAPMRLAVRWHRRDIEETIEVLLAELDRRDGDTDREPGADDEPSLGWTTAGATTLRDGDPSAADLEEDDSDRELSLGWDVNGRSGGGCEDLEADEARP